LTYTNSIYGISFRFPSNFHFEKSSSFGAGTTPNLPGDVDLEGTLLADTMIPEFFWGRTDAGGIMLIVGVNPKLSTEACAALLDANEHTLGPLGRINVDGVDFKWREELTRGLTHGAQIHRRGYTGYSHGICYEFQIRMQTLDLSMSPGMPASAVDTGDLFAQMEAIILTTKLTAPNPKALASGTPAENVTKPWETSFPFPKELAGLGELADWTIHYPTGGATLLMVSPQFKACGLGDPEGYLTISLDYTVSTTLDDASANVAVDQLNAKVVQLIEKNGWRSMNARSGSASPETEECHVKSSVFITVGKGTGRCTANSPCTVSDVSELSVFIRAGTARIIGN
jgi:hypothetical protein